jgi:hypothetical protein
MQGQADKIDAAFLRVPGMRRGGMQRMQKNGKNLYKQMPPDNHTARDVGIY